MPAFVGMTVLLLSAAIARADQPVRIGYFHGGRTNLFYRAFIHDCFETKGTAVELWSKHLRGKVFGPIPKDVWLEGMNGDAKASGVELVHKIVDGEFDGGTIGEASFLQAIAEHKPIVAVALLGHQSPEHPGHAIILRKGVVINKPEDFKGKTLIARRAGPMDQALLEEFVLRLGLVPGKDVKILPQVKEDESIEWLKEGKIDGGFYHLLLGKEAVENGFGTIYRPMDWANPEMLQALLVFRADVVEKHPERVQRVIDGYLARIREEREMPDAKKDRSGLTGWMMREDYKGLSIPTFDAVPKVRVDLLRQAEALLIKHGVLKGKLPIERSIDNSFVDDAAVRMENGQLTAVCGAHPRLPFQNVLLIGWDGTRRDRLKQLLADGRMPNLKSFLEDGQWLDTHISTGGTDTKAGWTQILTGYDPEITGVFNNWRRYRAIPAGYTLPERLKQAFGPDKIATVFLSGKTENLGTRGPHIICGNCERGLRAQEAKWTRYSKVPPQRREILHFDAEPYHLSHEHIDYFENGLGVQDKTGAKVLEYIDKLRDRRFFLFVEFEEPDEEGHRYKEDSKEYSQALVGDDAWLGKIVRRLQELNLSDQTLIYIVTDHGFNPGENNHHMAPDTFFITNDSAVRRKTGDRKDVTPTILDRFGVDLSHIQPPLSGQSLLQSPS